MGNIKNTVILVLSIIVLLQSAFLAYFIHVSPGAGKRAARSEVPVAMKPQVRQQPAQKSQLLKLWQEVLPKQETQAPAPAVAPIVVPVSVPEKPRIPPRALGRIVLVLDDWGYNLKNKSFITDNSYHVTLSVLPGKPYSSTVANFAFEKNKDVIVHMPMEPHDKNQYGLEESTLLVGMDKKKVFGLLQGAFETVPHARGLSNHMGSLATEDARLMGMVMEYLKKSGLVFFDSMVSPKTLGPATAKRMGVRFATRDVFIDNEEDPAYIRQQILKLADRAKQTGLAFGIGHDRPRTIGVLQEMIPRLQEEGYRFVNLSEVVGS